MSLYYEDPKTAEPHRRLVVKHLKSMLRKEERRAAKEKKAYFIPDLSSPAAYAESIKAFRQDYYDALGWPLNAPWPKAKPKMRRKKVARDDLGTIYRTWIETHPGFETYGLLFVPEGDGPFPLIISQHGGGGTPELCSGFYENSGNYNRMSRRVLERGCIVYAPQLLLWNQEKYKAKYQRADMDAAFRRLGGTLVGFEIYQLRRALDALEKRRDVDADRIGMIGLSWGGFYTLMTAAAETRIKAAVSSCSFTNGFRNLEWSLRNGARTMHEAEVASLVCPRALCIEVGKTDDIIPSDGVEDEVQAIAERYRQLGIARKFRFRKHPGWHELDKAKGGIDFLMGQLETIIR